MNVEHSFIQLRPARMAERLIVIVTAVAPGLRPWFQTALIRSVYSSIGMILKNEDSAFLNYGYEPLNSDETSLGLDPRDEADRFSIQLYSRVAGARDLRGKDVLEVGCGRGGGASFIARYLHPASLTCVDLSQRAVRYCQRNHRIEGLKFLRGEAEHLPLPSNSFGAVVNIESSHCYPSFERFLAEVSRVLRPGGDFLFADLLAGDQVSRIREQLKERFTIIEEETITPNVLRALELDSDRRNLLIRKRAPRFLHQGLQVFASVNGSPIPDGMASGQLRYVRFALQKAA